MTYHDIDKSLEWMTHRKQDVYDATNGGRYWTWKPDVLEFNRIIDLSGDARTIVKYIDGTVEIRSGWWTPPNTVVSGNNINEAPPQYGYDLWFTGDDQFDQSLSAFSWDYPITRPIGSIEDAFRTMPDFPAKKSGIRGIRSEVPGGQTDYQMKP